MDTTLESTVPAETSAETAVALPVVAETNAALDLNEETLKETLTAVFDPELHLNIVELGLVYGVTLKPKPEQVSPDVTVQMTLTSPACPYGPVILGQVPMVIKSKFQERVGEVDVDLVFSPPWDPATMASEDVKMELGIW